MKVIVAGGRDFKDYELLCEKLDFVLSAAVESGTPIEIVSGGAAGADMMGEHYAAALGYPVKRFPADWKTYGKSAGFLRNKAMAEYATHCVCFWDGQSPGTRSMIDLARDHGLKLRIVPYSFGKVFV